MSEMIDLAKFHLIWCPKSFCWCGEHVNLLALKEYDPDVPMMEQTAYYICSRCDRLVRLGSGGCEVVPGDPEMLANPIPMSSD